MIWLYPGAPTAKERALLFWANGQKVPIPYRGYPAAGDGRPELADAQIEEKTCSGAWPKAGRGTRLLAERFLVDRARRGVFRPGEDDNEGGAKLRVVLWQSCAFSSCCVEKRFVWLSRALTSVCLGTSV